MVVGVEAAGVGEDPQDGVANEIWLAADDGFRLVEGGAVGAEAEDGQDFWTVTKYLCS